jgi:hypothetical protein
MVGGTAMKRFVVWAVAFMATGFSFPRLLARDAMRRMNFLKDGVPEVDDSYERVFAPGRTYHDLKNVTVEWTRADPQLAAKCMAFLVLVGWLLAALLAWWVIG